MTVVRAVTGASSGIGAATVSILRERGESVIALDRVLPPPELHEDHGTGIFHAACDITNREATAAALDAGISHFGVGFAGVVHCAGVYLKSPSEAGDMQQWSRSISTNLTGSFVVASLVGERLLAAASPGSIVLLSSTAALLGDVTEPGAGYAASKGGVVSLGRQLAVEWGGRGIRTNVVIPGVIDTPMTTIVDDPEGFSQVLSAIPVGRIGTAAEVADVCAFLASDRASFVNGAALTVDGGQSIN